MPETTIIGTRTEGMVLAAFLRQGWAVLLPFGGCLRYDLVFDAGDGLKRVQCKTGRLKGGGVSFNTASVQRDSQIRSHYVGAADYFGVYCPSIDKVYLVPVEDVGQVEGRLRIDPSRNNQSARVRWAAQYEI